MMPRPTCAPDSLGSSRDGSVEFIASILETVEAGARTEEVRKPEPEMGGVVSWVGGDGIFGGVDEFVERAETVRGSRIEERER